MSSKEGDKSGAPEAVQEMTEEDRAAMVSELGAVAVNSNVLHEVSMIFPTKASLFSGMLPSSPTMKSI